MAAAEQPVVVLRGVNHHLGEGALRKQILFDITTDIAAGEVVTIMGPSGSGKTTLLNLIGAVRTVHAGSLRVLGEELCGADDSAIIRMRQRLGFIFQHHHLLDSLTACQNVQMGLFGVSRKESQRRAAETLTAVGLAAYLDSFPNQLSGGQCQRVAVARALVRNPELVLADEPTASLDKQTGRETVELLRRLARERGCTVVMVTHDPRILDVADRLMYLEDGRLSSFASVTSTHAVHLLTSLRPLVEAGQLGPFLARMKHAELVDLMRTVGAESEQFLNVADFGSRDQAGQVFEALLRAGVEQVCSHLGARAVRVWVNGGEAEPRCVWGSPGDTGAPIPLIRESISTAEVLHQNGTLCIPLQDRDYEVHAAVEVEGAVSRAAAERTLRDFVRPFGLLAQIAVKLEAGV